MKKTNSKGHKEDATDDALFLQPWYLSRSAYLAIRALVPRVHINKMHYYFEDWGCIRCGKKKALYGSNGFCEPCDVTIRARVSSSLKQRMKEAQLLKDPFKNELAPRMRSARRLLSDWHER